MSRFFQILRTFLNNYGVLVGTGILLLSWTFEKFYTSYWQEKVDSLGELRTHVFQDFILAQSNAIFLTRKKEVVKTIPILQTNQDVFDFLVSTRQVIEALGPNMPMPYQEGISYLKENSESLIKDYGNDLKQNGLRELNEEESNTYNNLATLYTRLVTVGEGVMANQVFYEAALQRLKSMKKLCELTTKKQQYGRELNVLLQKLNTFKDEVYTHKPLSTSISALTNNLYDITDRIVDDVHEYSRMITKKKYRYSSIYKALYVFGSLILLSSILLKNSSH